MSINNVNTQNNIVKLALKNKSAKTSSALKPDYMKMTGSIFNAPGVKNKTQVKDSPKATLAELNTKKSIEELTNKPKADKNETPKETPDNDSYNGQIKDAKNKAKQVKQYTAQTKKDAQTAQKLSNEALQLGKGIKNSEKAFSSAFKQEETQLKSENQKLAKLAKETEQTKKEVDNAQKELETLMGSNSINGSKSARIKELQTFIGAKVGLMQQNGKAIYSLQRSQSRTLSKLNKTNSQFIKAQNQTAKQVQQQQNKISDTVRLAQNIEMYSAGAQALGSSLATLGELLIASAGKNDSSFGKVLVATGNVMKTVGSGLETTGQIGQAAANTTKTIAYAAEGNVIGALQSSVAALNTGKSAFESTKNLVNEYKGIDLQAKPEKINIGASVEKLGKNFTSIASIYAQNQAINSAGTPTTTATVTPKKQLSDNHIMARNNFRMQKNQMYKNRQARL